MSPPRPHFWVALKRSQIAALVATGVDFGTLVLLVEVGHVWYVAATAIGAFLGGFTNFMMGRHWSFEMAHARADHQALRYAVISGLSLLLNTAGVFAFTDWMHLKYQFSRLITALAVGILFNFPMHRHYVFR